MPVPSSLSDLTTVATSNSPGGGDAVFPELDNYLRAYASLIAQVNSDKAPKASPAFTGTASFSAVAVASTATFAALMAGHTQTLSNQPGFCGANGSTVTGTTSTTAHTTFTERHDRGSNFDATTGVFTAPRAGVYHFAAEVLLSNTGSSLPALVDITGSTVGAIGQSRSPNPGVSGTIYQMAISGYAVLAQGETVTLRTTLGATTQAADAIKFSGAQVS